MSTLETQSPGVGASGVADQYADGKAAKVWQLYIGEKTGRTTNYKTFLTTLLRERNALNILDAACGTGVDSIMLIEEGFKLTSADFSDKMLKEACKTRWDRRREPAFFDWEIEEANWLTLPEDVPKPAGGFDAVLCMGNSFPHLLDDHGDLRDHKKCFKNFEAMLKPGGILIIDHRNYDFILKNGRAHKKNIYYNSKHINDIKTQIIYENNKAKQIVLKYKMDVESDGDFVLSYQPHTLSSFNNLLKEAFGQDAKHQVFGDFKTLEEEPEPAFYIHVIEKPITRGESRTHPRNHSQANLNHISNQINGLFRE